MCTTKSMIFRSSLVLLKSQSLLQQYMYVYLCCSYLDEYNQMTKTPMKLVMFKFAIEHVSRISRVLKQDNGHVLCIGRLASTCIRTILHVYIMCSVGIGGSGRQSAAKLATFMADYDLFQIEITKNYTTVEWRDDIKKVLIDKLMSNLSVAPIRYR